MTQKQLAEMTGVDQSAIARYETGETIPRLKIARRLAEVLGILVDQIDWPALDDEEEV